ncbi:ABC transporter ATP-binding protein [Pelagibacterium lentulum]|uniref:ABC transporter ATPase n=1 Tax=Pelagibacterium lentulum TaxID=2029865 RepID=A0A916VUN7_9HYPH|nr:ABC transporter ATP-binding protein [Pelagibacterium lentulum]GGA36528.1 ABC transporter ATPase [Pelagibacterium lentulum]
MTEKPSQPALEFAGVSKTFDPADARPAVSNIDFALPQGMFISLLGPSGCGKTTLLRLADGLIAPDSGTIAAFGAPPRPGPEIGFVFQSFRLIPWASVAANVEFSLRSLPLSKAERTERALHWLEKVGLSRFAQSWPDTLSGGMKQRVALARAFAPNPSLLLMDEPFASLDAQTRELMQAELLSLWSEQKASVLFVTHSVDEALLLSDTILLMGTRPGRIVETLTVDLERPRDPDAIRADTRFIALRQHLSKKMRELVLSDPQSDFYGR